MSRPRGTRRWVPIHRRMAIDIAMAARHIPSFPVHRCMQLADVEDARREQPTRIGWASLLAHAHARVSMEFPELRDVYVSRPLSYMYRHPHPVGSITIHRADDAGNERLVWGRLVDAHHQSPYQIQSEISRYSSQPVDTFFRDGLRLERRPLLMRLVAWRILLRWSGRRRAKHVGTFSISSLGGLGALNAHHPLVCTTSLAMGPIQRDGRCDVVMLCDHRVLEGALAARILGGLEHTLRTETAQALNTYPSNLSAA